MLFTVAFLSSCRQSTTPKPRGYFRIELPEKKYVSVSPEGCPFSFEIPEYAEVQPDVDRYAEPCWMNIVFRNFNGEINISYKKIAGNLSQYTNDSRSLVYKHTVRAEAIDEKRIYHPEKTIYGLMYDIGGNAASSVQFYITDSTNHFIRAALYFNVPPQSDSLAPVIEFIKADIGHLVNTWKWK